MSETENPLKVFMGLQTLGWVRQRPPLSRMKVTWNGPRTGKEKTVKMKANPSPKMKERIIKAHKWPISLLKTFSFMSIKKMQTKTVWCCFHQPYLRKRFKNMISQCQAGSQGPASLHTARGERQTGSSSLTAQAQHTLRYTSHTETWCSGITMCAQSFDSRTL